MPVVDVGAGIGPGAARRALDIVVAAISLCLLSPVLLAALAAARISTGASALYRQRRVGQGGVPFTILKIRTMRPVPGPEVTVPGDSRVTRLGAVLRRSSVDELPQLVNVLLGAMTLVGPRPESIPLAVRYPADLRSVFRYRPGLTGPSQVLLHDEQELARAGNAEEFYLTQLVPRRVAVDLHYLRQPTLRATLRWLWATARYLLPGPAPAAPGAGPGRAGAERTSAERDNLGEPASARRSGSRHATRA